LTLAESASPQLENGYTKIANELLEAMARYPFNGTESRVLRIIVRKTYGWGKIKDVIPYSQISKFTDLDLRYVKKIIKRLVYDNVIFKEPSQDGNILSLNKNYCTWRLWKTPNSSNKIDTSAVEAVTPKGVSGQTSKIVGQDTPSK